jgi:hypothetical protein
MNCDEVKGRLVDCWNQGLDEEDALAVEGHLAACQACAAEAERLGDLWLGLGALPTEEPRPALRGRFHEALDSYRGGLESARQRSWWAPVVALWPSRPAGQMALSIALLMVGLLAGLGLGYAVRLEGNGPRGANSEIAQLRGEVDSMRQMVALSLLQQQSAGERLRGVSWANRVESPDTEVLSALLDSVNHDPNVNVQLAAIDALHAFGSSPVTRRAVVRAISTQQVPLVEIALIDLAADLREEEAAPQLRRLAEDSSADAGVRERAKWALEKVQ